jgi:hypothetical protein
MAGNRKYVAQDFSRQARQGTRVPQERTRMYVTAGIEEPAAASREKDKPGKQE